MLGPILTLFAGWVVDDCLLRNQKSPYCLMREGNFLASLINLVASHRGVTVEARPLWASRYALRSASIVRADEPELRGYFNKRRPPALRTVARDLGLSIARLRALAHIDHDEPLAPGECDRLIQALLQDTPARQRIRDATSERRSRLLAYYERAGLFDQDQVTIVDLGWAGSLQEGLNGLLREKSRFSHLRGLYFGTNAQILKKQGGCSSFDSFLFHLGSPIKPFGILSRTPEIIEQSCMCEEGSFFGLCEKGEPLTFPLIIPAKQVEETSQMQRGVRHFASLWLKGNHDTGAGMNHSGRESVLARLRATLVRSLDDPVLEEVHLFRDWVHDDNDGSLLTEPLLGNEQTRRRAQDMTPSGIREFLWLECFWPAGLTRLLESEREQRTNARMCPEPSQGGFI